MTKPSETPRTDVIRIKVVNRILDESILFEDALAANFREACSLADALERELSAAHSALAEKERELTEVQAEAFDKIMAAEARVAEAEKALHTYGAHAGMCAFTLDCEPCSCGLDAALGEGKAT